MFICASLLGLEVISPNEFEVVLYLNQMGVFNFVDDGSLPGCAVLKVITIFVFFLLNYQNELESQIFIENHQAMVSYRNVIEQIELRCNLFNLTRLF